MGFSDRILGKKNVNGGPHIESVSPAAALPGGEVRIAGSGLRPQELRRPRVQFGDIEGTVVVSSDSFLVARVPEGATSGPVVVSTNGHVSNPQPVKVAVPIAENLHPVTNPALDAEGNIYVTFSGSRGQKVPVAIFKIDTNYAVKPFVAEMMNATAIAFDRQGQMYVSSRYDGAVYRVAPNGTMTTYAEGMGVATGIAFDREQNLYVGDRSGTIFKIASRPAGICFRHARAQRLRLSPRLRPARRSVRHRADDLELRLRVPHRPAGQCAYVLSRPGTPAGLAFDAEGNLYVAALSGRQARDREDHARGQGRIWRSPGKGWWVWLSRRRESVVLATTNAVHHLAWNVQGLAAAAGVISCRASCPRSCRRSAPRACTERKLAPNVRNSAANRRRCASLARRPLLPAIFIYTSTRERGDHRHWLRAADSLPHGHQLALSHRTAQPAGRRSNAQDRSGRRSAASGRRQPSTRCSARKS